MDLEHHNQELKEFINDVSFPCIMAKAVMKTGFLSSHLIPDIETEESIRDTLKKMYGFIDDFRSTSKSLSSFVLMLDKKEYASYEIFEQHFWKFLARLHELDKKSYPYDPRVSSDPRNDNFSYSIKSEAFFILILHPDSPRWARRFKYPAIVFNPHVQFENLRERNLFKKIQNVIRKKDKLLQGQINPMLNDYGERSEVFQYTGKVYSSYDQIPLEI